MTKRQLSSERLAGAAGTLIAIGIAYLGISLSWWAYPPVDPAWRLAVVGGALITVALILIMAAVIVHKSELNE